MNISLNCADVAVLSSDCGHFKACCFDTPSKMRNGNFVFNFLDFTWYDNRFKSFHNWPKSHPKKQETLARVGFYYMGKGDKVE